MTTQYSTTQPAFFVNWQTLLDDNLLDQLANVGFCVVDNCFSTTAFHALQTESGYIDYRNANLTQGERLAEIRGDRIRWIDEQCPIGLQYLAQIQQLGEYLNQTLFTGIRRCEAHYAHYPIGFGYQWHSDNPIGRDERVISAVFYLNQHWGDQDGGEILLIDKLGNQQSLQPQGNRLIIFDSNLRHQVNITHKPRFSIATWLRRDNEF